MTFFGELRRRNVFRVAAAYAVGAWLIVQVGDVAADSLGFPDWFMPMLFVLLGLGFILAAVLAWAFELTPEGLLKTEEADVAATQAGKARQNRSRGLNLLITLGLVAIIAVLAIERIWFAGGGESSAPAAAQPEAIEKTSVAVLPFVNMSSSTEQEYFSDGITEEIINTLVRQTDLSVAARTSVFAFKGDNRNVSEIGRSLDVTHVIEGSVRSAGNQVRITAQLIAVDDGFHLWSDTYDRELTNIFAVQEDIAASVAEALSRTLVADASASPRATTDPTTYDLYLQARALLRQRGITPLRKAAELLDQAVTLDPDFAPAWATAAQVADVIDDNFRAIELAQKALSLDPVNVDALNALAAAYRDTFRWAEAEAIFLQALTLDPESSELLEDYAEFLGSTGRKDEMLDVARRGWLIDPYLPPLAAAYSEALLGAGQREEALRVIDELSRVANAPMWVMAYRFAILTDFADNERLVEVIESLPGEATPLRANLIAALRDPGDRAAVDSIAQAVAAVDITTTSPETWFASYALLYLGRPEPLLEHQLDQARNYIPSDLEWIFAPIFDDLRALPGFVDLIKISQLPGYWDANGWPDYCSRLPDGEIECQ